MKKKVLATLLCGAMAASLLVGCGGNKDNTEAPSTQVENTESEATTEVEKAEVTAEEITVDPLYHFTFDNADETGYKTVIRETVDTVNTIAESDTYVDKEGNSVPCTIQYANGPVDQCAYFDGNFGLKFDMAPVNKDTYTISFWVNADRLSDYGPTLQMGCNMDEDGTEGPVTWINFTKSTWGAGNVDIFPVAWNRNSAIGEAGVWPWVAAYDDLVHGKKEWVCVTVVTNGNVYACAEDGLDRLETKFYINGELMVDTAPEKAYGGLSPQMFLESNEEFEAYFGINYWDSIFKGFVDDMYIFDYALTDGQVKTLFEKGDVNVVSEVGTAVEEPGLPTINITGTAVGATDFTTGFWGAHSNTVEVKSGESASMTFINYNKGAEAANWNNFFVVLQNVADAHGADVNADYKEYGVLRCDNYGWCGEANTATEGALPWTLECDWDWDNFCANLQGATVTVTVTNNGGTADVVMTANTVDGKTFTQSYKGVVVDGDLHFCVGVDGSCLDVQ